LQKKVWKINLTDFQQEMLLVSKFQQKNSKKFSTKKKKRKGISGKKKRALLKIAAKTKAAQKRMQKERKSC
jgi:hypothetical protein